MDIDWVTFFNVEHYKFTSYFKAELAQQSKALFENAVGYKNVTDKYFFNLMIGMQDLEMRTDNNWVYINVSIISPDSMGRDMSIAWRSPNFKDPLTIHTKVKKNHTINFSLCNDFPVKELKKYLKPPKAKAGSKVTIYPALFPDLSVTFNVNKRLLKAERAAVLNKLAELKGVYVSDFTSNNIMLDFQIDSKKITEAEIKKSLAQLKKVLNEIIKLDTAGKIISIDVR